ncbi:MAG: Stk1 family PASTA domain-containing Ser/Thr kinase [Geodermatophilaceae bacterium]|nr:Stk1 family PASTA domain-containing Ser/Thr kinase [Geodermatophilaceae bacterium]
MRRGQRTVALEDVAQRLALDVRLGREVAIKVLRQDLARDSVMQVRFRREALASAALNHPAIVAVFDTGEDADSEGPTPYIVMEYVEGETLRDVLKRDGALPAAQALGMCAEICAALDFSHRNGIVHRDVKPGNVMISPNGTVKVMDFGIARAVSDSSATMTSTAAVIGTAQYLSPEQARGESVDARSDVYSCGCLLYELLAGAPPFTGDSPVAVAYQHVREDPLPPSEVNPSITPELDAIVLKAMAKNPANRYQSAEEMRADLLRAREGGKVEATPLMSDADRTSAIVGLTPRPGPVSYRPGALPDQAADAARHRRNSMLGYALLALALIGVVVAGLLIIPQLAGDAQPEQIAVPVLTGLSQEQAETRLAAEGLAVGDVAMGVSSAEDVDLVVDQDPAAGDMVDPDSPVDVTIGTGPATVLVPQIIGLTEDAARSQLLAEGLEVASVQSQSSAEPAGRVVDSSPMAGASVAPNSPVTLFVSTGTLPMPPVFGLSYDAAVDALAEAGFGNVVSTTLETDKGEPGTVVGQDPAPGDLAPNDRITLTIAVEPPPPPPPVTTTEPPPPSTTSPTTTTTTAPSTTTATTTVTTTAGASG